MATLHDLDSPSDELPPPTYEFSQHEFDQKISHALEQSRAVVDEEDDWEVWDEAAFATAAARLAVSETVENASSSRSPPPGPAPNSPSSSTYNGDAQSNFGSEEGTTVQPLRIVKKSREPSASQKERPNWYEDAGLEHPLPVPPRLPRNVPASQQSVSRAHRLSDVPSTPILEREPTPPPIFEPIGPSLDGPPYEGYDEPPPQAAQPERTGLVMAYVPGDSRPASPLHSPTSPSYNISQVHIPPPPPLIQPHPYSLPASPSPSPAPSSSVLREVGTQLCRPALPSPRPPAQRQGLRPTASYRDSLKTKRYLPPRVAFDPRVAYGDKARSSYFNDTPEEPLPQDVDPASFYTASVSSIYSTNPKRTRTTSAVSSSLYSQSINSQSTFSLSQPPSQLLAHSQVGYSTHEGMRSPVPSVYSVTSQSSSQNHPENHNMLQAVYQTHLNAASARTSTYQLHQPSMYQPTSHQVHHSQQHSQQLQQSTYQPTAYQQQPSSNPVYQSSGYTPTAY